MNSILMKLFKFKTIVLIACGIGAFIQVNYVVDRYLKFDYTTLVRFEVPTYTILPDIVFCFELAPFINYSKALELYPQFADSLNKIHDYVVFLYKTIPSLNDADRDLHVMLAYTNYLTIHLAINQITGILYEPHEVFGSISVRAAGTKVNQCEFRKFYRSTHYCILLDCSVNRTYGVHYAIQHLYPGFQTLIRITINQTILSLQRYLEVAFIPPNTFPYDRRIKWARFAVHKKPKLYIAHYYSFVSSSLPPPYTSCFDYSSEGFVNRADKLNNCLNSKTMKKLNCVFHSALVQADLNASFAPAYAIYNSYYKSIDDIISFCGQITKQIDCETDLFIIEKRNPIQSLSNRTYFLIEPSSYPEIRVFQRPRTTLLESIIIIGGILSFWFGFAINVHFPIGFKFILSQLKRLRRTKSQSHVKRQRVYK